MRYYHGYYYNHHDYDATASATRKEKLDDGREVIVARSALTPKSILCSIPNPMLVALDTLELKRRCYHCYHSQNERLALDVSRADEGRYDKLEACENCEMVYFCSSECKQIAMRNYHRPECGVFQRLAPRVPPSNLRAVIRVLLRNQSYPQPAQRHWDSLVQCNGHVERFRKAGGKRWEDIITLSQCALEFSGVKEKFATVLNMFCALLLYGLPLQTQQFTTIGIVMHPWTANVAHSCEPNSILTFDPILRRGGDHRMRIVPLRNIARDEKITISYVNGTIPLCLRAKELRSSQFFDCKCAKCVNESVHGWGLLVPDQLSILDRVRELVATADLDTTRHMPIQRLGYALHLLISCSWDTEHYPYCFILRKLVSAYINDEQYNTAFAYAILLKKATKTVYKESSGYSHPVTLADSFVTLRLMDKIIAAEAWASQDLDLAKRGLNLVGLRRYWADKLCVRSSRVQSWDLPDYYDGVRYIDRIRRADRSAGDALKDPQKRRECSKPLDELADEMLEKLRRW